MNRRLLIIGAAFVLIIVACGVYLLFFSSKSPSSTTAGGSGALPAGGSANPIALGNGGGSGTSGTDTSGGTQGSTASTFGVISNEPAIAYFVDASNNVTTVQPDGKIELIANGRSSYLSSSEIGSLVSASFSYDGKKILVETNNTSTAPWNIFDISTKTWTSLTANAVAAAWSPNDYQVAYFANSQNGTVLQTLDMANAKAKPHVLLALPHEDFSVLWKSPASIILSDRSSAFYSGSILSVSTKTGAVTYVVKSLVGLEDRWNDQGTMALVLAGAASGRGGQLGVVDATGNLVHRMSFLTMPTKCAFTTTAAAAPAVTATSTAQATSTKQSTSTKQITVPAIVAAPVSSLLCGIPRSTAQLKNSPLPDAYNEGLITTSDDVYQLNLTSGALNPIFADQSQNLDITDVSMVNSVLFFINRYDSKLYAVRGISLN